MNRLAHTSILVLVGLVTACTNVQHPTRPSPTATPLFGDALSQSAAARVVDWSALTARGGDHAPSLTGADAPGAPANLAFTVSGTTVILTWSAPGAGGATVSYIVEAGTGPGLSNIASFNTGGTATTLTVTGVPAGTYVVRIRARNADGTSGPSNEVTIVVSTGGPCPAPAAPTGLTATASGNTLVLQWNTVNGAVSFIIEAGSAPSASNLASFDTQSAATSFTATAPNGTYYIRIRVRTSCGTSAASNEAVVTVGAPPGGGLTGRWVGLQANGDGATSTPNECGVERWDLVLDLVQSGTAVSGTLTQTVVASGCDPTGRVQSVSLTGSVSGSNVSLTAMPSTGSRLDISGTFTATRMTGTGLANGGAHGRVTFAVNKQ